MSTEKSEDNLIISEPKSKSRLTCRLVSQVIFPLIGGFLFGYDTGVISGALLLIRQQFQLTSFYQEIIVSSTIGAAAISSLLIGCLAEIIGRKPVLLISGLVFVGGSLVLAFAHSVVTLIAGRVIVGIGVGICATVCPIYIAEISPESIRGRLILLYNCSIVFGQLISTIVDALFYNVGKEGWRYMFGFAVIPGAIQVIGMVFIPESYRWLISKNRIEQARKIIIKDNQINYDTVDEHIQSIIEHNERIRSQVRKTQGDGESEKWGISQWILFRVLNDRIARHTLLIGCGLQMLQQIVGINTVMYYTGSMLRMAGVVSLSSVLWLTVLIVSICFFPSLFGFLLIDKIGRRKLALFSLLGAFISLVLIASIFQVMSKESVSVNYHNPNFTLPLDKSCGSKTNCEFCTTSKNCGFCLLKTKNSTKYQASCLAVSHTFSEFSDRGMCSSENSKESGAVFYYDYCQSHLSTLIVIGITLYLVSFAIGMGPVPWTLTAEIYPLWCREFNMALSTSTNWIFNLIISLTFLSLTETITKYGTFWLYSSFSFLGLFFIYFCVPETNQRTLEEITGLLEES